MKADTAANLSWGVKVSTREILRFQDVNGIIKKPAVAQGCD